MQDDAEIKKLENEIKANAVKKFEKEKALKFDFPCESINLPSRGLVYSKDNPLAQGQILLKYMTAREEDILTTPTLIKQGKAVDMLLKELILGNGEGIDIDYGDLIAGDRNSLMVAARILAYGASYKTKIKDPFSDENAIQLVDFNLLDIEDLPLHDDLINKFPNITEYDFLLPKANIPIKFRFINHRLEQELKVILQKLKKRNTSDLVHREYSTRLKLMITEVDGSREKKEIDEFVDKKLMAIDSQQLKEYIKALSPNVDMTFLFRSDETGEEQEMSIPIDISFFWPGA